VKNLKNPDIGAIKNVLLRLLARREQSRKELITKLSHKDFPLDLIESAIDDLATQGLQSDLRYAECLVESKRNQSVGPRKIKAQLQQHNIADELIRQLIDEQDENWFIQLDKLKQKRFGPQLPEDIRIRQKMNRYFIQRGFTYEQIERLTNSHE